MKHKVFKKVSSVFLCATMLVGCGTSNSSASALFKAGTYTGTSENGRNGSVTVEVTLSSDKIESITVGENNETAGVSDPAIERIPQEIVDSQSLSVDTVTGATITSKAIIEAVSNAIKESGADPESLTGNESSEKKETTHHDVEANLVIVGGGAAGISAAVSAAYEGMKNIVVLEKTASIGGNAIRSGGFIEDLDPSDSISIEMTDSYTKSVEDLIAEGPKDDDEATIWDDLTKKYKAYKKSGSTKLFDCSEMLAIEYHRLEGSPVAANMPYGDIVNEFDTWFADEIGGKLAKLTGIVGYTWPRWTYCEGYTQGSGYFHYFEDYIKNNKLDITIIKDTSAESLIQTDGTVTGVKAESTNGDTYTVTSKNGVILASGGFSANGEMLMKYDTQWGITDPNIKSDNNPGNTGDGIVMAQEIGAGVEGMDNIMMFPLGDYTDDQHVSMVGIFNGSSNLMVNTHGKRFVNETASRFEICHAVFEQDDPYYYIITDSINSGSENISEEDIQKSIDNGYLYKGDTIEELAENMGVEPNVLTKTVEQYNTACSTNNDELFGRVQFSEGSEIVSGPFYATPLRPVAHITIGGLTVDDTNHVLDTDGNIINGLYAAGEVINGSCGLSAFAYGKKVGKMIATQAK